MSNFEKYLDILNKGKSENLNPNKGRTSPLRPNKCSPDRFSYQNDWDSKKQDLPFNFYTLLNNGRQNQSLGSESASI